MIKLPLRYTCGCYTLALDLVHHVGAKHIEIDIYYIREQVARKYLTI